MNLQDTIYFGCAAYSSIHPHRAAELNHLFCTNGNGYEWDENGELVECCGETTFKNGKRRKMASAITNVFKRRRKQNKFSAIHRRISTRKFNQETKAGTYKSDPETDKIMADFEAAMDANIKKMRELKTSDPAKYDAIQKKREDESKELKRRMRDSKRWEYAIPADIKSRTEFREPRPGEWEGYNYWYPMSEGYCKMLDFPENIADDFLLGIIETCNLIINNPPRIKPSFPRDPDGKYSEKECERTVALAKKALDKAVNLKVERHFQAIKRNFPRTFKGVESIK